MQVSGCKNGKITTNSPSFRVIIGHLFGNSKADKLLFESQSLAVLGLGYGHLQLRKRAGSGQKGEWVLVIYKLYI